MNDNERRPSASGQDGDPALFRAFVQFRLKSNTDRDEIVRQLIGKGLTYGQASTLVDSMQTQIAMSQGMGPGHIFLYARVVLAGLAAAAVSLAVWNEVIPDRFRPAGYILIGIATGLAVALAAWTHRSNAVPAIAVIITLLGCYLAVNNICAPYDRSLLQALIHIVPTETAVINCFKTQLIYHHEIFWIAGALVAALLVAGQRRIRFGF